MRDGARTARLVRAGLAALALVAAGCAKSSTIDDAGATGGTGGGAGGNGAADAGDALRWYRSCGAPVCGPGTDGPTGDPLCTTERTGDACGERDVACDPSLGCAVRLVCTDHDPTMQPGGCPISRARYKRDIHYLDATERAVLARDLFAIPLARFRYRRDLAEREQLGFVIEDVEASPAVDGDHVDLYGYATMGIAAIQEQAARIDALERELRTLRARSTNPPSKCKRGDPR